MIVARWSFDARFGHKEDALALMREWMAEVGPQIGPNDQSRLLVGSIGAGESTIVAETILADISALDERWKKLAQVPSMGAWSKRLEPHMVSGSNRWEVYRIIG